MQYLVTKHARHIKHKIDETFYALDFYEYKKETEESAKDSNKSAKSEPVWDGPLRFLRYACEKHSTFRIFLEQNRKNRNRYDAYLEIVKRTVKTKQELTIYHEDCRYQCALCNKANNN